MLSKTQDKTAIGVLGTLNFLCCNLVLAETHAIAPEKASYQQRKTLTYDSYILGPDGSLQIELLDIPELSCTFSIGPDVTISLPRQCALYIEGLTVEELCHFLTK